MIVLAKRTYVKFSAVISALLVISVVLILPGRVRAQVQETSTVEIRITTPKSLVLFDGEELAVVYHLENVQGGWIELEGSKYNSAQRYRLTAGRLNTFDLKLEELRDFYAFDSLHVTFRPRLSSYSIADSLIEAGVLANSGVVRGSYSFDLQMSNYQTEELTRIVIGSGENRKIVKVLESKPQWKKLLEDLAANPGRHKLTKIIRIVSWVGVVASTIWAWQSNSEANDVYDEYMTKIHPVDISASYRRYEDLIEKRNILGAFGLFFAATGIGSYVFSPGDENDLVREYEAKWGKSGISLDIKGDYTGIALTFDL